MSANEKDSVRARRPSRDRGRARITDAQSASLTARELEVLRDVANGLTAGASGRHLGISPHTVQTYRAFIIRKLSVANLPQAVAVALRAGLID